MRWAAARRRGAAGALFMGLTMGIVAAPCVGPIVVGLLVFVGSRQDPWLGFLLFFVLALGMGLPYLVLAMAAGSICRACRAPANGCCGPSGCSAASCSASAAYYVAPLLPPPAKYWLLPGVVAVAGVYLGFIDRAGRALRYFPALKTRVGVAMLAIAVWLAWPVGTPQAIAWEPLQDGRPARRARRASRCCSISPPSGASRVARWTTRPTSIPTSCARPTASAW